MLIVPGSVGSPASASKKLARSSFVIATPMYQCVNTMIHRSSPAATSAELARRGETAEPPNAEIDVLQRPFVHDYRVRHMPSPRQAMHVGVRVPLQSGQDPTRACVPQVLAVCSCARPKLLARLLGRCGPARGYR